jgi:hypothetical protein
MIAKSNQAKVKIKPIRATIVEDPADWKKMWQTALTTPTDTQLSRMKHLRRCFTVSK